MATYNVLYLSSEITPFAKVGGLADVANSLPRILKDKEHDIRVLLPKYKFIRDRKYNLREVIRLRDIEVPMGDEVVVLNVKSGFIPESKVQAYFVESKPHFDRPEIYNDLETGKGWPDNHFRFALFARTAFEMLKVLYWQPDLIHFNDWSSGLVSYYLKTVYKDDPFFKDIKTVFTIHNIAYQGEFDPEIASEISANTMPFDENHPAWHNGKFNFLHAGIKTADMVTTVSPTYAQEILTKPEIGCGMGEALSDLGDRFKGVLNGIDNQEWNPETNGNLQANYTADELDAKSENRASLCEELSVSLEPRTLLIGMVSRLVEQKGYELLISALDKIMEKDVAIIVLGVGEPDLQKALKKAEKEYPGRFIFKDEFDTALAHRIEAGVDAYLMPSRYEPCGMNQMFSLRYGTPPIVHGTGGLIDTVDNFDEKNTNGTGFIFDEFNESALIDAIDRALTTFSDKKAWKKLMRNGMAKDFSWMKSSEKILDIYADVLKVNPVTL
ncbi:MAG: glycogen/starch synthase [Candidatus Electryonea clarkiae]|nr:glycogen/starch synthase [Candidatus Electryonea clarkiae]